MVSKLRKYIATSLVLSLVMFNMVPALAAGGDSSSNPTGTTVQTGPTGPTGPQVQTGPQCPTGPQGADCWAKLNVSSSTSSSDSQSNSNSNTGANSDNSSKSSDSNSTSADVTNNANTQNGINGSSDTGDNTTNSNTITGGVNTGDANAAANVINVNNSLLGGNLTTTDITGNQTGNITLPRGSSSASLSDLITALESLDASNNTTGANSSNTASSKANNDTTVNVSNNGTINNLVNLLANSGRNTADKNTVGSSITTGAANAIANLLNFLNTSVISPDISLALINVFGNWTGDLVLPVTSADLAAGSTVSPNASSTAASAGNSITGADSSNKNSVTNNTSNGLTVTNNADTGTTLNENANTGGNTENMNTVTGGIQTGATNVQNNLYNVSNVNVTGNTWYLVLVNYWNGAVGYVALPASEVAANGGVISSSMLSSANAVTGEGSLNNSSVASNNTSQLNVANKGTINNNLTLGANTGNNSSSMNTIGGNITTGNASIGANVLNFVNSNFNVQHWILAVVNVFGTWNGGVRTLDEPQIGGTPAGKGGGAQALKHIAKRAPVSGTVTVSGSDVSSSSFGGQVDAAATQVASALTASSVSHQSKIQTNQTQNSATVKSSHLGEILWFVFWAAVLAGLFVWARRTQRI